jgi:microcystin-dependent protein
MSNPFIAEIRIFPFNFAPKGWAFCNGQLLPLSQNTALFSLLGTTYGGDGKSTFALPNLQGALALQQGQGAGLSLYDLGEQTGGDLVTLLTSEMTSHNHTVEADFDHFNAKATSPNGAVLVNDSPNLTFANAPPAPTLQTMNPTMISVAGGSQPHNNLMPYLTLNYCIALQGVYPPRS